MRASRVAGVGRSGRAGVWAACARPGRRGAVCARVGCRTPVCVCECVWGVRAGTRVAAAPAGACAWAAVGMRRGCSWRARVLRGWWECAQPAPRTAVGAPGGEQGVDKPLVSGIAVRRACDTAPDLSLVGGSIVGRLSEPSPTQGQHIALLHALGRILAPAGAVTAPVPSVADALSPLCPPSAVSHSSCQASVSHALSLRAKPPRPNATLPLLGWLCSLLLWNPSSCPSWQSSASPLLGTEHKFLYLSL